MRVASILATGLTVLSTVSALPSDMSPARPMGETPESKALEALTTEPRGNTCETVGNLAMCCRGVGPIRTSCNYALDKRPPIQPANTTVFKAICNKKKKEARCCRFFFALINIGFDCYAPHNGLATLDYEATGQDSNELDG